MATKFEFHDEKVLIYRLSEALRTREQEVVFLLGSPLSEPTSANSPGVPNVSGIIDLIRAEFVNDVNQFQQFSAIVPVSGEGAYQAAFRFLIGHKGQDVANLIVKNAVLLARTSRLQNQQLSDDDCRNLELDNLGWKLSPGLESIGQLVKNFPKSFGKKILTTNFDPLIQEAISRAGGQSYRTSLDTDGSLSLTEAIGCHVIHLHGYWWGSDTLHTTRQLTQTRPRLKSSLIRLLRNKLLLVCGYGGWDDVFTSTLFELVSDESASPEILWTFRGDSPTIHESLSLGLKDGLNRGRVTLYSGISCNEFFPRLLGAWTMTPSTTVDQPKPISTSLHLHTTIEPEKAIKRFPQRKRSISNPSGECKFRLRIFDGSRQLFKSSAQFLITITDSSQAQPIRNYFTQNELVVKLPFSNNSNDLVSVTVSTQGYQRAGSSIKISDSFMANLDLMLIRDNPGFNFVNARWPIARNAYPFLGSGFDNATAQTRYSDLIDKTPSSLAAFLNIAEIMSQANLSQGTLLDYIHQLRWDAPFAPEPSGFFAWCNVELIDQIKISTDKGNFAVENNPGLFHPGASSSWKETQRTEANIRLTFYEGEITEIDGIQCVLMNAGFDYYQDPAGHLIVDVFPKAIGRSLGDPAHIYALRWAAGRTSGIPEFSPLFTLI